MLFLQHDDMLQLVKLEQAELRRQVALEVLLPPATGRLESWTPGVLRRLGAAVLSLLKTSEVRTQNSEIS
jgi:hypothetical protein